MADLVLAGSTSGSVTLSAPAVSGSTTLTLPTTSGTVLATGSSAVVTQAMLAAAVVPLGVGQTWQVVTGSRASNVTYTNSTSVPIFVVISTNNIGSFGTLTIAGVGVVQQINGANNNNTLFGIVPAGATYIASSSVAFAIWSELR